MEKKNQLYFQLCDVTSHNIDASEKWQMENLIISFPLLAIATWSF